VIYTFDSDTISGIVNGNQALAEYVEVQAAEGHDITMNAVSYFEVKRGLLKPQMFKKLAALQKLSNKFRILAFDALAAEYAADIYHTLESKGEVLDKEDVKIAATGIRHRATVVTNNTKHFARVPGIRLENWIEASRE
jgi:tRNA(fMet)-specific endonuclease VapC